MSFAIGSTWITIVLFLISIIPGVIGKGGHGGGSSSSKSSSGSSSSSSKSSSTSSSSDSKTQSGGKSTSNPVAGSPAGSTTSGSTLSTSSSPICYDSHNRIVRCGLKHWQIGLIALAAVIVAVVFVMCLRAYIERRKRNHRDSQQNVTPPKVAPQSSFKGAIHKESDIEAFTRDMPVTPIEKAHFKDPATPTTPGFEKRSLLTMWDDQYS
ncbi:hypothetical protein SISNIDRAFT_448378 [Sistotremastrum niveocremeum HHB9708]|uniref:Uncharacterized protein n=1 Tax=Sistotremastrum niveocremeum HHB9708 TaxID=1314777 RepID=A0A164ZXS7_9AGAM|nr:hypothetical protein SISNIDRAFT_448378 [Sistotremastrum niveocremeum HHB9708]